MPHSHRSLQHWDHWLTQSLGSRLLETEEQYLSALLNEYYGKHAMLIGVPHQISLVKHNHMAHQVLLSPFLNKIDAFSTIESNLYELPIASASVDLVLLPHTLEHIDNPHKLLSEACRIVKMEGLIIILGFNPWSLWGIKKKLEKNKHSPWSGNFLSLRLVKKWLTLADFELIKQDTFFFRPPLVRDMKLHHYLQFMEWLGPKCCKSLGGVYILMAKARGIPLTPIKMHWKQPLSGVKASFSGPNVSQWR